MKHRRCRACSADVVWASTAGGVVSAFNAARSPFGRFRLYPGETPEMRYDPAAYGDGYTPHIATCPKADATHGKQEFDLLA